MRYRFLKWLPALLLLLSQTALVVHQADIDAHQHADDCQICLLAHGLDHAVSGTTGLSVGGSVESVLFGATPSVCPSRCSVAYRTRAPPFTTQFPV